LPRDPDQAAAALAGGLVGGAGTSGALTVLAGVAQGRQAARQRDDYREAEEAYRRAIELLQPLTAQHPAYPDLRYDLAITWHNLGWLRGQTGDVEAAGDAYRRAARHLERLVQDFPAVPHYQNTLEGVRQHSAQLPDPGTGRAQASAVVVPGRGGGPRVHNGRSTRRPACRLTGPAGSSLLD
jgi:tetratricopeptide (TPR) repeat protein